MAHRASLTVVQRNDGHAYFVTEQGVAPKYGRNRQQHTERSMEALSAYLAGHRPLHTELRGTFVAV